MVVKISEECISCGACEAECPNRAISEGPTSYAINSERCTECVGSHTEPQCVQTCPVSAIALDETYRESREELLARWRILHPGEMPKTT
ncbi:MAG: YfhL family 4Fe-4S dicluster ferredoxin [Dehalococcoidia bacterium]|nr:YfhL family 4Fe-4S dicluster ferredoxin [Dehalococcoidia bacterium]